MKTRFINPGFMAVIGILACSVAWAQTPHIGDVPELPEGKPLKMEKVTYLGITAKAVDSALRAQLNLPEGVGLTVMTVDHRGPAGADLQQNDVLQKLDDQLLIDAHQLVTLIHLHHPGDTVTLSIIREAKAMQVTIKLGEKERAAANDSDHAAALPGDKSADDQIWAVPFDTQLPLGPSQMAMSFKDDVYSASITTKDGHKQLTVKDSANNIVAQGPADTAEEWQKFSPDVRQHLEVMRKVLLGQQK